MFKTITTVVASLLITGTTFADTIYVAQDGSGNFSDIQSAVDAASNGDEIIVGPGTYTSTNTDPDNSYIVLLGTKHLVIRSSHGAAQTILDGEDARGCIYCGSGSPGLTVIDGFTMQNGREYYGAGLATGMSEPTIQNCVIRWNNANWWGGGIVCHGSSDTYAGATILNCDIYENAAGYGGGNIYLWKAEVTVDACAIRNSYSQGFNCWESSIINMSNSLMCSNAGADFDGSHTYYDFGGNCFEDSCIDSDTDGTFDCLDGCPDDPDKTEPGICGCGVPESVCAPIQWSPDDGGNGNWYQAIKPGPTTWAESRSTALARGGDLTSMETDEEITWVFNTIASNPGLWYYNATENDGPYIGGFQDPSAPDYDEPAGGWYWLTGTPLQTNYWGPGQPNYASQDHLHFWSPDASVSMTFDNVEDTDNGGGSSYIIEWSADCNGDGVVDYGQILDGTFDDLDENGVPDCCDDTTCLAPVQWKIEDGGNGNWYQWRAYGSASSWTEMQSLALMAGGHLATTTSLAEEVFVRTLFQNGSCVACGSSGIFIGGYQDTSSPDYSEPSGGWRWVTGEPWDYENWNNGEPGNTGGEENFLLLRCPGQWNDGVDEASCSVAWIIEWSDDCNDDGIVDYGQILDGSLADEDDNGIPDVCQCDADVTGDGVVNITDVLIILGAWGSDYPPADLDDSGEVDIVDLLLAIDGWGECG
ncbi:MAG: hypothetical protein MK116_10140 [Phycisphaerales bacterium]|nr:hypothetical protein [Phycisphaerales bacterium]